MLVESTRLAGTSIWRQALPPPESSPAGADLAEEVDLAVIGGGLTGLSAAYHVLAANPGARVLLLESERIGHGASSRSTGMLTPGVGQDLGSIVKRFGADAARAMYLASLRAVEYVGELTDREGIDAGLRMTGQLVVAQGRSGRRRLARQAELMERLGLPCERLDGGRLRERLRVAADVPGTGDEGPAALRLPTAGVLHPGRLLVGLAEAVTRCGGRILEGAKVVAVSRGAPARVRLADRREVVAGHVVVASSGYASTLNLQHGRLIPLHLRLLLTEPLSGAQLGGLGWPGREGVIDSRRVFNYFRLTDDDRILFGGGRPRYLWGGGLADRPAEGPDLDRLVGAFRRRFPSLADLPIARSWTGVIAYTLDTLPVIAPAPGHERVLFVGGWCGHGIALSVFSGRWVQEWMAEGKPREVLPWSRPRPPRAPTEAGRWLAARTAGWAMEQMDRMGCERSGAGFSRTTTRIVRALTGPR
ncbi:MAG: FAD-binding oxidoreductase [Planctomycetaceae bacterium]|nr:FAD-binding oxidoreductase [Planctomycetaceae bacterium]